MLSRPSTQSSPLATRHPLTAQPGDWAALHAAAYSTWHRLTHAQAGRQRVAHAQLCLSTAWRTATAQAAKTRLQRLATFLAASGAKVEILFVVSAAANAATAELRLRWVAWHAPPLASYLFQLQRDPSFSISHPKPPSIGATTMKLPNFFGKPTTDTSACAPSPEPTLSPQPQAPVRRSGSQLPLALSQIAELIARQEVHDLRELGMNGRYRLFTLSFWVSAANQPALRNLMEINQRDPGAARQVVQAAFAKSASAPLLDTGRLALVFTPGDNLPRDAAEVLIVCGRDTVALPYTYSGEIELPQDGTVGAPLAGTTHTASASGQAAPALAAAPLCLWLQTAQQPVAQRWVVTQASQVGAADDNDIRVDWSRVSGHHLSLLPDPSGGWTVLDQDSSNGTLCLDAEHAAHPGNPPEAPLIKGKATALPRAGCLRLGNHASDPLLHFAQIGAVPVDKAVAPAMRTPSRRVTELGPVIHDRYTVPGLDPRSTKV